MRWAALGLWIVLMSAAYGQVVCQDGTCALANRIEVRPLQEEVYIDSTSMQTATPASEDDRLDRIICATVRVTVSGVCGSGTVVGRDRAGNALVLTNAHVAGTQKGRVVQLERWNQDGTSEKGQGVVIASGYGRGMSVDFALLKCNSGFARQVIPIPLADRYPKAENGVTTFGCPRCEWPSMQVLKLNRAEGQILSWKPEAIGGRSGSSLIDYSEDGPRVVGLLTWGGGGEGLGQSTPFLLRAMRGALPATLESLPSGVKEVSAATSLEDGPFQVPSTTRGDPLQWPLAAVTPSQVQDDVIDSIVDPPATEPSRREPEGPAPDSFLHRTPTWTTGGVVATSAASSILLILSLQYGIPLLLRTIRQFRQSRGQTLLTEDQFNQLLEQYQQLLKLLEQNAKAPPGGHA